MKRLTVTFLSFLCIALSVSFATSEPEIKERQSATVMAISVNGAINPVTAEFIIDSIKESNKARHEALVIELDTPGGLDTSMRSIIKEMNLSGIPIIVYVHPSGARAASAGVFITMASHIAAMTPGTNIGAAHPVGIGQKMDKTMVEKATNDAVAYLKSIAEKRGRNVEWAEEAVRKSASITEKDALSLKVIDIVAPNLKSLLEKTDMKTVKFDDSEVTLHTVEAQVVRKEMGFRLRLLSVISNPNIAYMLMLLGFYGLFFELTNPGAVFPGVVGGISLILAFYSFQVLPVNYAGLLLIILSIILFILEATITSHGLLTIGGIISMFIGSLMLFETPGAFVKLSLYTILPAVIVTALFFTIILGLAVKAWKRKPVTGIEGLLGLTGTTRTEVHRDGMIMVHGEIWRAWSDEPINKGEEVSVIEVAGLRVKVRKEPRE